MPEEKKLDSTTLFTYQLRENSKFDSIHPITKEDILFSFKLAICPGIVSKRQAAYYEFIDSLYFTSETELNIITHGDYFLNKYFTGDFFILPKHIYDEKDLLSQFSIKDLRTDGIDSSSKVLQEFIESFNNTKFKKEQVFIIGSGPYELKTWESNKRIVLSKKKDWWGSSLGEENNLFHQYPNQIQYEIIGDDNSALAALKSGNIDLIKTVPPKEFNKLKENEQLETELAIKSGYDYIGFNIKNKALSFNGVRTALAHMINKAEYIEKVYYGLAKESKTPIPSSQQTLINKNLKTIEFSVDSAKMILTRLGWTDSNKNGILDNSIDGELVELDFTYLFNSNDEKRKSFGLILQKRTKQIGIKINLQAAEWSNYLEQVRNGGFDIFYGSKGMAPIPPDFFPSFHSTAANGGRNYSKYVSSLSDSLIEAIRNSNNAEERIEYFKAFQEQLNNDLPIYVLLEPMETFVYSNKLKPIRTSSIRPNYWAPSIQFKN